MGCAAIQRRYPMRSVRIGGVIMNRTVASSFAKMWVAAICAAASLPLSSSRAQTSAFTEHAATDCLSESVVTARRRAENLQDVPVAVTALSADILQQQAVTSLSDLNSFVPNMKIAADRATS